VADILNTVLSKLIYIISTPSCLLYLATLYIVVLSIGGNRNKFKRKLTVLTIWILVAIAPVGQWLLLPLEHRFPAPPEKEFTGIIVLGGGQRLESIQHLPFSGYGQHSARIIAALSLSKQHNVPLYFIGGGREIDGIKYRESLAIEALHLQMSIASPLIIDDSSRHTFDNAHVSKRLMSSDAASRYVLITSAAHMPRAVGAFRQAGLSPIPYPVNYMANGSPQWFTNTSLTTHLYLIDYAAHEWLGLLQYYALGRSSELFPKNN